MWQIVLAAFLVFESAIIGILLIQRSRGKKAETSLLDSEERFRATFDQAAVGISHVASDGSWLRVNDKLCEIVGFSREELLYGKFQDITHPDDLNTDLEYVRQILSGEIDTYSMEKRYIRKDKSIVWINLTVSLIREKNGQPKYFISVVEDITKKRKAEMDLLSYRDQLEDMVKARTAELQQAKAESDTANRSKSSFLSNMGHELKSQLGLILGYSNLMLRDDANGKDPLSSDQREHLATVHRSGEHLVSLLDNVLEISRMEVGKIVLNYTNCELHYLFKGIDEVFREKAEKKGITLTFELGNEVPNIIRVDEVKLYKVMVGLLNHAFEYKDKDGVNVRVGVLREEDESGDILLGISVRDTGCRTQENLQVPLFESFANPDRAAGLGGSLIRRYVELMGGEILVRSTAGGGAILSFSIRGKKVEKSKTLKIPERGRVTGILSDHPPLRVLIMDEDKDVRKMLGSLLTSFGFETEEASSFDGAVALVRTWAPDLVLLDAGKDDSDGMHRVRTLHENGNGSRMKVVALATWCSIEEMDSSLIEAFDGMLCKPVKDSEFLEMMKEIMGVRWEYARGGQSAKDRVPVPEERPVSLSSIPPELLKDLEHSALRGEMRKGWDVIDRIRDYDSGAATKFGRLWEDFEYAAVADILASFEENKKSPIK